jgi:hypothetical protein
LTKIKSQFRKVIPESLKQTREQFEAEEKEVAANTSTTNHYLGYPNWNGRYIFKFLQEYLDDACETVFSKHWKDITYKGEL